MAITMTTLNVGRRTATTRGGSISEQNGQGGERTRDQAGRGGGQIVEQGSQGSERKGLPKESRRANGGSGEVPDFATIIAQQIVNMNNGRGICSYKEFLACHPKDYDGKGGVIVYTRWIEKMESSSRQ
ncbi:hypothetical protein Tco_0365682 [Tanacetum coccineum]